MQQIGKYKVARTLGVGGMGAVYQATDSETGQVVALKTIKAEVAAVPEVHARFAREGMSGQRLQHENITAIYDVDEHNGMPFLVMEYLEGEDLRAWMKRRPAPSIGEKLRVAMGVAEGLAYAHRQQVVHRDVKPENIFVRKDGTVKLMDFGVARLDDLPSHLTHSAIGTPLYMSPEQVRGLPFDYRTDIFSFGLIVFELFVGRHPFLDSNLARVVEKIAQAAVPPLQIDDARVAKELDAVVSGCLAREPAQRFRSLEEAIALLQQALRQYETQRQLSPAIWGIAVAVFILAFVGLGAAAVFFFE